MLGIFTTSSCPPEAPTVRRISARVPPNAASTCSLPGASATPPPLLLSSCTMPTITASTVAWSAVAVVRDSLGAVKEELLSVELLTHANYLFHTCPP
jgi:hypothetical protein